MSSFPSQSTSIPTFSSRAALRPKIVPLYATSIPSRTSRPLSIHQTLLSKAIYHPYTQIGREKPSLALIDVSSAVSGDCPSPNSPLTPMESEQSSGPSREVHPICVPPPHKQVTVSNAGWNPNLIPTYRVRPHNCRINITDFSSTENC